MNLEIETIQLGPLETNTYVLIHDGHCWIVDIGMWPTALLDFLDSRKLVPERILLTHGHGDHIAGVEFVHKKYPDVKIACPAADAKMLKSPELNLSATFLMGIEAPHPDELLEPGQKLKMGDLTWEVLDTSGHTAGGVSFYCASESVVLTGDALFASSVGRCDLPGGDEARLLSNIREKLLTLPDETRILPGHHTESTIGIERTTNPYLVG